MESSVDSKLNFALFLSITKFMISDLNLLHIQKQKFYFLLKCYDYLLTTKTYLCIQPIIIE